MVYNELQILVCGHGNMANELTAECTRQKNVKAIPFEERDRLVYSSPKNIVAVHFGSGSQLLELVDFCGTIGAPIIQGSTGGPKMPEITENPPVIVIKAPNTALPIVKLLMLMPKLREIFDECGMVASLKESHQASKKSVPGTALEIARGLGINGNDIVSIRDPHVQETELGVPMEFLTGHGFHFVEALGDGIKMGFYTKVYGRRVYAAGAIQIARMLISPAVQSSIPPGIYLVGRLLEVMQ